MNFLQWHLRVNFIKRSISDLKKLCNTMNVDYSLSWDLTTLWFLESEQLALGAASPASNAHKLRELEILLLMLSANSLNSRLFMLLGLNVCPIVNRYCIVVMSLWIDADHNINETKFKVWPHKSCYKFKVLRQSLAKIYENLRKIPWFLDWAWTFFLA